MYRNPETRMAFQMHGEARRVEAAADTPLLHVLRNRLGLKVVAAGKRYGDGGERAAKGEALHARLS